MKRLRFLPFVLVAAILSGSACVHPPPNYSAQAQRGANANQLLQELVALGQTAQNLNALPSGSVGKLSDATTAAIRDASLTISDAIPSYISTGLARGILDGFASLNAKVSADVKSSPSLKVALALIATQVQLIAGGIQ